MQRRLFGISSAAVLAAACGTLICAGHARAADPGTLTVHVDQPGAKISPTLYGLMTEEINHSYDGGLYGELIQNRIFSDLPQRPRGRRGGRAPAASTPAGPAMVGGVPKEPLHWSLVTTGDAHGTMQADQSDPVNDGALKTSLRLDIAAAAPGQRVGVANGGYWGIPVRPATTYTASFYARAAAGFTGPLTVDIESADGKTVYATGAITDLGAGWKKYSLPLTTAADAKPTADTRFVISADQPGSVWFSLVSLFPPTFHNRANGNRVDLMELLGGMHPAFLRFPGGNYLEGNTIAERFDWKKTVGPLEDRPGHESPWNYRSSDGMGLLEFLDWCEDLKMQPVLAVYAGYSLRGERVTGDALKPFVQDALDEIEYVTGDTSTKWGAQRVKDGHPQPFKLTYVEIGNEDQFDRRDGGTYDVRFTAFYDAIKAKYPQLQCIATTRVRTRTPDVIDDHFYRSPAQMEGDTHHYDKTDRNGPKVFVGEWATRQRADTSLTPDVAEAVSDGAWLTGLERNSDVVVMSCYAPLLVNINPGANQWKTDLIGYDALTSYGSPSYYVQKMFSENRGDVVLPVTLDIPGTQGGMIPQPEQEGATPRRGSPLASGGVFSTASRDIASGDVIIKIVNAQETPQRIKLAIDGANGLAGQGTLEVLSGQPTDVNSVEDPKKIVPQTKTLDNISAAGTNLTLPAESVSVLRIKAQ